MLLQRNRNRIGIPGLWDRTLFIINDIFIEIVVVKHVVQDECRLEECFQSPA